MHTNSKTKKNPKCIPPSIFQYEDTISNEMWPNKPSKSVRGRSRHVDLSDDICTSPPTQYHFEFQNQNVRNREKQQVLLTWAITHHQKVVTARKPPGWNQGL